MARKFRCGAMLREAGGMVADPHRHLGASYVSGTFTNGDTYPAILKTPTAGKRLVVCSLWAVSDDPNERHIVIASGTINSVATLTEIHRGIDGSLAKQGNTFNVVFNEYPCLDASAALQVSIDATTSIYGATSMWVGAQYYEEDDV